VTRSASTALECKPIDTALLVIGSILLFGIYSPLVLTAALHGSRTACDPAQSSGP
jgi:hypothetical protein